MNKRLLQEVHGASGGREARHHESDVNRLGGARRDAERNSGGGGGSPRGAAPGGRSRATGGSTWHSTGIRAVAQGQGMNSREVQTEASTQDNLAKTPM